MKYDKYKGRKILANNIVYYRLSNNWTQEELAEKLESSPRYVSEMERAKRDTKIDFISRIANTFQVDLINLFTEREEVKNHRIAKRRKK